MSENRERRRPEGGIIAGMEQLDPKPCYRALKTRDARFDGRLFVGVTSTGVYCRPICPARSPKFENCRFFPSAAAAQEAGFRPCLRCRPETAPDLGSWRGTSNTVSRGLALIGEGALDGEEASVDALAERLGIGERQLRRLFQQHLGASPITVAQTRRVLFAKQLIHDTRLPMAEIAMASGFGSVRRFNETFQQLFRRPPSALRRRAISALPEGSVGEIGVTVRLSYRPPYDWDAMLAFLRARAIEGVEWIGGDVYSRTVLQDGLTGTVEIRHLPGQTSFSATIRFPSVRALPAIVGRIRRVFDLGADVAAIGAHLAQDPWLAPLIAERPGLRAPGGWDGFELAVRAVLGQQVSIEAACKLGSRLTQICGTSLPPGQRSRPELCLAFPSAAQVARADLSGFGMPNARKEALMAIAQAALSDPSLFQPQGTVEETVARLRAIRGIGEWTAHYIALRAVRETDAFPASDIGLLRGAAIHVGTRPSPAVLQDRAETWRPWRAYAAQHLWAADAAAHG
ncbi:DNA-3-methyladenine glycosylase 2 family protein [Dongia deserti]|uniref:DNA-3-methyladenine glycosylase 2 family protein n=1 Tax=Dongia deserti TaxID=2268030 RepID=UPI002548A59B|nr:DNA-3-methyladenine glycosylase 2 [Dongia deserti]